jgi:hypothetical protein
LEKTREAGKTKNHVVVRMTSVPRSSK